MKRILLAIALTLAFAMPSQAVFNERDLSLTLQVLRYELGKAYSEMESHQMDFISRDEKQHNELVGLMERCNELSLMLYSQKQNFTFDLTYALQQVTDQYYAFNDKRMPFDEIIEYFEIEIDRYGRLVKSLKLLPPVVTGPDSDIDEAFLDSLSLNLKKYIHSSGLMWSISLDSTGIVSDRVPLNEPQDSLLIPEADPVVDSLNMLVNQWHDHEVFTLDSLSIADRDSCLAYATGILRMLIESRGHIIEDSDHYNQTNLRLKEFFDYAQDRYSLVQKNLFLKGQDNYWSVLKNFGSYASNAFKDASDKYGRAGAYEVQSEWRGPMVIGFTFTVLLYLLIAGLISNLAIRLLMKKFETFRTESFRKRQFAWLIIASLLVFVVGLTIARMLNSDAYFFTMASALFCEFLVLVLVVLVSVSIRTSGMLINNVIWMYLPVLILGLLVITCRIIFIPNSLITLVFPPLLLAFAVWQYAASKRHAEGVDKIDRVLVDASLIVTGATMLMSVVGYVLLSLQLYIWWIFQLAIILFVHTCKELLLKYRKSRIDVRVAEYREKMKFFDTSKDGSLVEVTWLYDFARMALVPLMYVLSFPASLFWASGVFDLTSVAMKVFSFPFLNASFIHLSLSKLLLVTGLCFLFSYLSYLVRGLYRVYKFKSALRKSGADYVHENEVNLTLANNVIAILVWGVYVITAIIVMKIPTKSLSVVTAGLAAGIGFAMKDILNNFFYGVQLMSGRLKIGDYIECDGIRGQVDNINYQSTQIIASDGSVMEFPNSSLFSQNFRNLTRNNNYEFVSLPVGVAYGADIEQVRSILVEALSVLRETDKYGREVVEPSYGVKVTLQSFGDSSVNLAVKQYVLVEQRFGYAASANEIIYNVLNKNGIEIPFPQQDIYIKQMPVNNGKSDNNG